MAPPPAPAVQGIPQTPIHNQTPNRLIHQSSFQENIPPQPNAQQIPVIYIIH